MASVVEITYEMKDSLPNGWAQSTIGRCFNDIRNGTIAKQNKEGRGVPISRIETIQEARFDLNRVQYIADTDTDFISKYRYLPGDIAFSHINSYKHVGKTALYEGEPELFIHGMNLLRLRLGHHAILPRFAYYYMQSIAFREAVRDHVHLAVNQVSINQKNLSQLPFRVAPLVEQKRVVAKIDQLLARVDLARQRLANVPALLKHFRQSVLTAACSGRLTEDWREKHPDIEPAEKMVEKLYRLRLSNAKTEKEKKKIDKIYSYKEIEHLNQLPEAWSFVSLNKLCDSFQYGTSKKSLKIGKVPVLRMGNLQNGKIDWGNLKYSSDSEEIKKYKLLPDTVLFNRTNSPELVGKASIYKDERPAIFAGYLIRINNHRDFLCSNYLNYCLNTNYARLFCSKVKTDGVSQSNINAQKLASFEVPLCSLRAQQEIVRRVKELFVLWDKIENRVKIAIDRADKMTQSILAKAFRGELVPTEAELARLEGRDYETAQQLLEAIS